MSYDYVYKIILAGSVGVGKTSIIRKITTNEPFKPEQYCPTIGIEFISHILDIEGKQIKCRIWDTAGQETYNSLINIYFRQITGAVLVFDGTEPNTLEDIENIWIPQINNNNILSKPQMILVENKSDLKRNIDQHRLNEIINKYNLLYVKTSVLHNTNTKNVLNHLCKHIYENTGKDPYHLREKNISLGYKNIKDKPTANNYFDNRDKWCCRIC